MYWAESGHGFKRQSAGERGSCQNTNSVTRAKSGNWQIRYQAHIKYIVLPIEHASKGSYRELDVNVPMNST